VVTVQLEALSSATKPTSKTQKQYVMMMMMMMTIKIGKSFQN